MVSRIATLRRIVFAALVALAAIAPAGAQETPWRPDARLTVDVETPRAAIHPQEMILLRIRGHYRVPITLESLKLPEMAGFRWLQVGPDRWSDVMESGLPTRFFQRTLAVYPQAGGRLTIPPFVHALTVVDPSGKRVRQDIASAPTVLQVAPAPATGAGWWLPARSLRLEETWSADPGALAIGQSVRRTVTITAEGVTDDQIPPPSDRPVPGLITFEGAITRSTVIGVAPTAEAGEQRRQRLARPGRLAFVEGADAPIATVSWTWAVKPATDDPVILPDLAISWFDTTAGTMRDTVLPGRTVALQRATRSAADLEAALGLPPLRAAAAEAPSAALPVAAFTVAGLLALAVGGWPGTARRRRLAGLATHAALATAAALLRTLARAGLPAATPARRFRAADRAARSAARLGLDRAADRWTRRRDDPAAALYAPPRR